MANAGNRGNVIFRGMLPNIPGNVLKHSGECRQTFRGILSKIPRKTHNGLTFKFNDRVPKHVLLNYLFFAVDLTSAKKSTKIMLSSKMGSRTIAPEENRPLPQN